MTNPFEVLGLAPRIDLATDELEERYLTLSREHHPDFHPDFHRGPSTEEGSAADHVAVLQRSAAINDAYRTLRDPWRRAEALILQEQPTAFEATKTLCPMFLMEAMEVREATLSQPPARLPELEREVTAKVDQYFADVATHLLAGEVREAATLLHQSNYYRKALSDLRNRMDAET
jgi:molecular chaperone HscB